MGELKNIVFNPQTCLFEDCTNPTAHLTQGEVRKLHRQRQQDPTMAMQMKPVIRSICFSGGEHPIEGSTIEISWYVEKAQQVVVTFPSGKTVEFFPVCSCQFVVPRQKCQVRIIAYNGKYSTQRTIQIRPKKLSLIQSFLKWIMKGV